MFKKINKYQYTACLRKVRVQNTIMPWQGFPLLAAGAIEHLKFRRVRYRVESSAAAFVVEGPKFNYVAILHGHEVRDGNTPP